MGESACFMQPFSYASGLPSEQLDMGNPIHALGQSVSFGRFVTESASWDSKWSVFPHNRYVEEAEKFSRPGSVAQKKAFFEAHYKKMAARKAAALLEQQANAAQADASKSDSDSNVESHGAFIGSEFCREPSVSQIVVGKQNSQEVQADNYESGPTIKGNEIKSSMQTAVVEEIKDISHGRGNGADLVDEDQVHVDKHVLDELPLHIAEFDDDEEVSEQEPCGTPESEKPLLTVKGSDLYPVSPCLDAIGPYSNPSAVFQQNLADQGVLASASKKKSAVFPSRAVPFPKSSRTPLSPAKSAAVIHSSKESCVTPFSRKSILDFVEKKRTTPKQLLPINLSPVKEVKKTTSVVTWKNGSSITGGSASKSAKECPTPSKTPTTVHSNRTSTYSLVTPQSSNRRTPYECSAGEGTNTGPKRRSLARDCSKFLSACKNKLQSPSLSTPFRLRTEERAMRRKEKLEEKFNADEKEKVQLQKKLKERAESEMRKIRQSFCFKARPLPDFYKEKAPPQAESRTRKLPGTCPQTPNARKPTTTKTVKSPGFLPRQRPLWNKSGSKQVEGKNWGTLTSRALGAIAVAHENRSPNIQPR